MLAVLALTAACARPTGDFGRAAPGFTHDVAMPAIGKARARINGEPVSNFNITDQEKLMHDRVWRFLVAPHAKDWFYDTAVEFQRTRLTPARDHKFSIERYYNWLRRTAYASSRVRYATLASHVQADIATAPDTFAAICAVVEVDRQRAVSARTIGELEAQVLADMDARRIENDIHIGWFARALRYRYDSYSYALDHLLVETPHEEARLADARLKELLPFVQRAEARDFCGRTGQWSGRASKGALPGRLLLSPVPEVDEYLK